jgi:hypothetical protein
VTTWREANLLRLCLLCGEPDAHLLRLPDGRNVRACDECLRTEQSWTSYETREPLPCEGAD